MRDSAEPYEAPIPLVTYSGAGKSPVMLPTKQGSIHMFTFSGVAVYLHWSWLLIAVIEIQSRQGRYESMLWNVLEYLSLFVIVLLHEFGHSLACRQVGGKADQIVLWPLGGVAFVQPPLRPGAVLWSIAAGPLVNVALFLIITPLLVVTGIWQHPYTSDFASFLNTVWIINFGLLIFNLLPIYPLDGGQIVQSILWFWLGRGRSLQIASIIGFIGVAALIGLAVLQHSIWTGIIAFFVASNCWRGFMNAQALLAADKIPRRQGLHCPSCDEAPPIGAYWKCGACGTAFDTFETNAQCPNCGRQFDETRCLFCGSMQNIASYRRAEKS